MDLSNITNECKTAILRKMDVGVLLRIRRMSKVWDNYLEELRTRIAVRSKNRPLFLKVAMVEDPAHWYNNFYRKKGNEYGMFEVSVGQPEKLVPEKYDTLDFGELEYALRSDVVNSVVREGNFQNILRPFEQLSAVHFNYICLDYGYLNNDSDSEEDFSENISMQPHFNKVFEHLARLKASCDWLVILSPSNSVEDVPHFLQLVKFKNICHYAPCKSDEIDSWPVKHCDEVAFRVRDVPDRIPSFFRSCKRATLIFIYNGRQQERQCLPILDFLERLQEDRANMGKLERITFIGSNMYSWRIATFPGMENIWHGISNRCYAGYIYKLPINNGFAYLYYYQMYEIRIYDKECDEEAIADILRDHNIYYCEERPPFTW